MVELTIKERLMKLETLMTTIMNNHLPHIQDDIKSVKTQCSWFMRIMIGTLLVLVANLVIMIVK